MQCCIEDTSQVLDLLDNEPSIPNDAKSRSVNIVNTFPNIDNQIGI